MAPKFTKTVIKFSAAFPVNDFIRDSLSVSQEIGLAKRSFRPRKPVKKISKFIVDYKKTRRIFRLVTFDFERPIKETAA